MIVIRKFQETDAIKAFNVIKLAFRSLVPRWYSKESVEGQIQGNIPKKIIKRMKEIHYFVAENRGKILGIGGYSTEKIHTFFVRPEIQGQGIGGRIMEKILNEASKDRIKTLKCWSTLSAVKFSTLPQEHFSLCDGALEQ